MWPPDILGGMSVGYNGNTPFIDEHGDMRSVEDLVITEVDGYGYSKTVTKVRTPKLLAVIREQFNCPTMSGMTLEDIPMAGGYSVHWEARLAGPEVCVDAVHVCPRVLCPGSFTGDVVWYWIGRNNRLRHDICIPGRHK
jgi:Leishmanolysin